MNKGERIKAAREAANLTQEELGRLCGTTKQTIYKYESGIIKNIPFDRLIDIANAVDCSVFEFLKDDVAYADEDDREIIELFLKNNSTDRSNIPSNIIPLPEMKKIPLLGTIACGEPILAEENIEGFLAMPEDVGADFCLRCKGDSMINARIFDGDIVYIRQQPQVEDGEIAAVMVGEDEATLKRVHLFQDHIVLEPENPQYRAKSFWDADMSNVRILGKAVAFTSNIR